MLRSITTLAMLLLIATTISHAQGFGGLLNKTKAKLNQATDRPVDTTVSTAGQWRRPTDAPGNDP